MKLSKILVKDLLPGHIVYHVATPNVIVKEGPYSCKKKGYVKVITNDYNRPINCHGSTIVEVVTFETPREILEQNPGTLQQLTALCECLRWCNEHDTARHQVSGKYVAPHASQASGTFGHVLSAIYTLVYTETGITRDDLDSEISGSWGGAHSWTEDVLEAVDRIHLDNQCDDEAAANS